MVAADMVREPYPPLARPLIDGDVVVLEAVAWDKSISRQCQAILTSISTSLEQHKFAGLALMRSKISSSSEVMKIEAFPPHASQPGMAPCHPISRR